MYEGQKKCRRQEKDNDMQTHPLKMEAESLKTIIRYKPVFLNPLSLLNESN
jgi:hypothetical protein